MVLGAIMNARFQTGLSAVTEDDQREASLLAGDAILNYRTVASFAHEE